MHVEPVAQAGMVVSLHTSSGLIEFTQDQPYIMEKRDDKQRLPFQASEVRTPPFMVLCSAFCPAWLHFCLSRYI